MHVSFFIHTWMKWKKSTVNSYDLISNHFHAKNKGKQLWNNAKFKLIQNHKNKLTNGHGGIIIQLADSLFNSDQPSLEKSKMSKYRLLKFVFYHCCFNAFFIFDSNATDVRLFTMTCNSVTCSLTLHHVTEYCYVKCPLHFSAGTFFIHWAMNKYF